MPPTARNLFHRCALPLLVTAVAALIWVGYTDRWSTEAWQTPEDSSGDPCEILARVRIAMDDPCQALLGFPHVERLAAPFGADWSRYPVGDAPTFALAGLLGRIVGPFAAVNLLGCALIAGAALSFFLNARHLRWRPEWAACGALLFAFSNYHLRWLVTLSFAQTWTLPPLLLLCAGAARPAPALPLRRRTLALAAGIGLWLGLGNPYFIFFAGCVIGGTVLLNRLRRAPWRRLAPLALLCVTMGLTLVASHRGFFAAKLAGTAAADQFDRSYAGAELYALKPIDLFMPPTDHRSHLLRDLGRIYVSDTPLRGEPFYNYLGVVGAAGLLWLLWAALRHVARPRQGCRAPDAALGALWCLGIATVGGGTAALALAGIDWFRASNRISVFIALWALLFLFGQLHRRTRRWPRAVTVPLAAAIGIGGWFEQTPWFDFPAARAQAAERLAADAATVAALEDAAGADAMLFQLPFVPFPEAGRTNRMVDYEHFRPFLASESLKLSYGGLAGLPATNWYAATARLTPADLVARLQAAGFSVLWIDRRAYADDGAALLGRLRALGLAEIPTARAGEIAAFGLTPAALPASPDLEDTRILPPWNPFAPDPPGGAPWLLDLGGWSPPERSAERIWRWARREASLGLDWRGATTEGELRFAVTSVADATLILEVDDRELARIEVVGGRRHEIRLACPLRPGMQRIRFLYPGRLRRMGRDSRQIGFMVEAPVGVPRP